MADYNIDPYFSPNAGPPNMAAQLFGMISNVPNAYQKGVEQKFARGQMARTEKLQEPIVGPNGEPSTDYSTVLREYLKRAGAEGAAGQLPTLWKQQFLEGEPSSGGSAYGPQNPRTSPDAQTPGGLRGETGQPAQPQLSSAGTDDKGNDTVRGLATERGIDVNAPGFKAAFGGVGIDRELNPAQAAAVVKRFAALTKGNTATDAQEPGSPEPTQAGQPAPPAPPQPGPMAAQPPPATFNQRFAASDAVPSGASGMVPPAFRGHETEYAYGLKRSAEQIRTQARREGIVGIPSKANEDKAAAYDKTADDILKEIGEAGRPTGAQKEARDATVQGSKGIELAQKQELTRGDALQKGLQGAAREYETALKPHLDAMRGIMNNPNFVSGAGVGFQAALNKIRSSPMFSSLPGYDPNAALPNEAIRKVMAASILNQTTELKAEAAEMGGSASRLFQQQISLMEKAAQNEENTLPALRYLTELQTRMGDHASGIANLANNYQGKYGKGVLDNGFNDMLSKYNRDNPIFKPDEIADQRRFAPPPAPAFHTKEEATAWSRKNNIPPGDPIKLPSGKIIPAP